MCAMFRVGRNDEVSSECIENLSSCFSLVLMKKIPPSVLLTGQGSLREDLGESTEF